MGDEFGTGAARLSGAAAVLLGWRPNEFWDATPAELAAALKQLNPTLEAADLARLDELRRRFPDE